jgi:phage protein D
MTTAKPLIPKLEIRLAGSPMADAFVELVDELVVHSHLRLPDSFAIRLVNPEDVVDDAAISLGTDVEILLGASTGGPLASVVRGEIVALEPDFDTRGSTLRLRGYDYSYKLNRSRLTATYQSMSYGDIADKVLRASGIAIGVIDDTGGTLPFVQQTNETAWDFLWRLAREIDFELVMTGPKINFRKAGGAPGQQAIKVALGDDLIAFRPRVTGVQQVDDVVVRGWDPATKQVIVATAALPAPASAIGVSHGASVSAAGGGTVAVVERPVSSQAQAQALANSVAAQLANTFVEGEGSVLGQPALLGGSTLEVSGVGTRFAGTYAVTAATHRVRRRDGYMTSFEVSGRSARTILGDAALRPTRRWARSVVVAVVTNNADPDSLGRVRVQSLELDDDHEGWWARLTSPSAGSGRGLLMLPQPGDEVLLAFEHDGDENPFVLGCLWNGTALPAELVHEDGSFHLASDKQVLIDAAENITITTAKDLSIDAKGKLDQHATGAATIASDADVEVQAGAAMKVSAQTTMALEATTVSLAGRGQVELQADGSLSIKAAQIQIQANAVVQISAPMIQLG